MFNVFKDNLDIRYQLSSQEVAKYTGIWLSGERSEISEYYDESIKINEHRYVYCQKHSDHTVDYREYLRTDFDNEYVVRLKYIESNTYQISVIDKLMLFFGDKFCESKYSKDSDLNETQKRVQSRHENLKKALYRCIHFVLQNKDTCKYIANCFQVNRFDRVFGCQINGPLYIKPELLPYINISEKSFLLHDLSIFKRQRSRTRLIIINLFLIAKIAAVNDFNICGQSDEDPVIGNNLIARLGNVYKNIIQVNRLNTYVKKLLDKSFQLSSDSDGGIINIKLNLARVGKYVNKKQIKNSKRYRLNIQKLYFTLVTNKQMGGLDANKEYSGYVSRFINNNDLVDFIFDPKYELRENIELSCDMLINIAMNILAMST